MSTKTYTNVPRGVFPTPHNVRAFTLGNLLPHYPTAATGAVQFALFGQQMDLDLLWDRSFFLPVLMISGLRPVDVPGLVRPSSSNTFGYALNEGVRWDLDVLEEALSLATVVEHRVKDPEHPKFGSTGEHIDLRPLFVRYEEL